MHPAARGLRLLLSFLKPGITGSLESWTWDGEGNLLTHTDAAGHTTHQTSTHFDVPATRTEPDGARYAFAYDTELRLTEVTNPQGLTWTYTYDPAGLPPPRPTSTAVPSATPTTQRATC